MIQQQHSVSQITQETPRLPAELRPEVSSFTNAFSLRRFDSRRQDSSKNLALDAQAALSSSENLTVSPIPQTYKID
jgi:hypothetical protein